MLDALLTPRRRSWAAAASSLAESYETKRNTQVTRNEGELPVGVRRRRRRRWQAAWQRSGGGTTSPSVNEDDLVGGVLIASGVAASSGRGVRAGRGAEQNA